MGRTRLLIVDDEEIVHAAVRMTLRRDYDIVDKMSAEEALNDLEDELEAGAFDVVLLDVMMPGVPDGVDFFRRLQEIEPARAPAVLFMTGDPHVASVLGSTTKAVCLAKPFSGEDLKATLRSLLAGAASERAVRV